MWTKRPTKQSPPTVPKYVRLLTCLLLTALFATHPAAAQSGKSKTKRDTSSAVVTPMTCNPQIGCTAGNPPTVWFNKTLSGSYRSKGAVAITDTVNWCDDGGLTSSSRSVTENGNALSTTYNGSTHSGCWAYAYSSFTIDTTKVIVGLNTIYASINDNFGQNGSAQFSFTYDTSHVLVTPDGARKTKPLHTSVADTFSVQNPTNASVTYNLALTCSNAASLGCSGPSAVTVGANSSQNVIVSYTTRGLNTVDTINIRATSTDGHQTDPGSTIETASQWAVSASFAANNEDDQQLGLCANDCFTAVVAHETPTYRSLGIDRSVALIYHGDRTAVRPYVLADLSLVSGATPPSEVRLQATVDGSPQTFVNGDPTLRFSTTGWQGGKTYRVAGQLDLSSLQTNMHSLVLTATAIYADTTETFTSPSSMKMMVINLRSPTILPTAGWTVAGIQQLYPQSDTTVLIVEGDGSGVYFSCKSYSTPCAGPSGDYSKLSSTGSGSSLRYTRAYPDSSKVVFDNNGHMIQSLDRWGNSSSITYDGSNHLSTISDPFLSSYFQFNYGPDSFSIYLPGAYGSVPDNKRQTKVAYDGSNHITSFTDPDGIATRLGYDGSGRLDTLLDRLGDTTYYYYNAQSWKLESIALPAVPIDGQSQPQRPARGLRSWQQVGVPTTSTVNSPASAAMVDTIYGLAIGAIEDTTKFTADRWGQPLKVIDPLGNTTTIVRSGIFTTSITNPLGQTDSYSYNAQGFLSSQTPFNQPTTNISYDSWGMPSQISGGNAPTVTRSFNSSAKTITTTVDGSYVSTDSLDSHGRTIGTVDAAGHHTHYHYDATFGNPDSTIAAAGQWSASVFDGYGRDSLLTALGHSQAVRRIYDVLGRDSLLYDGVNAQPVKYTYNALFLTTIRDQKGQVYKQDFNALGWPTAVYDPADTVNWAIRTTFSYDLGGRVTTWHNRRGNAITQQWDKLDRMTSRRYDTSGADSLWYSTDLRTVVASNAISVDTLIVGDRGAFTAATVLVTPGKWYRRVHSATGGTTADTTSLPWTNGAFQTRINNWDQSRGVLSSVYVGANPYHLGYTNELLPDSLSYGTLWRIDSLTTTHSIYARHYTASAVENTSSRGYAYDSLGRIATESEPSPTAGSTILRNYGYTGTGAVQWYKGTTISQGFSCSGGYGCGYTGKTVTNTWDSYGYGYDPVNNLTSQVDSLNGNALTTGLFKAGNRDTLWGTTSYTYDADGNRLSAGSTSYTWSAIGQLLKVTSGSSTVEYGYNALGDLVQRKTNGAVDRYFIWDNGQLLLLLDGSGNRIAEYAYLPNGEPLSYMTGGLTYYYNTDLRGDVVGVNDGVNVNQQINYGPWGNVENLNGWSLDSTRLGWKGNMWEGGISQLYYVHNRWYDPGSRSFISEDPIGLDGGINTYAYAGNDAVNGVDPEGLNAYVCTRVLLKPGTLINGVQQEDPEYGIQCTDVGGGGDGGDDGATIAPSTQPMQEPHTSAGPSPLSKVKSALKAAADWLQTDCGQASANLGATLLGDGLVLMGGIEVGAATRAALRGFEEAAVSTGSYHARVVARRLLAEATREKVTAVASSYEFVTKFGDKAQEAANHGENSVLDYVPFLDLVHPIKEFAKACVLKEE